MKTPNRLNAMPAVLLMCAILGCYPSNFVTSRNLADPEFKSAAGDYVLAKELRCKGTISMRHMLYPIDAKEVHSGTDVAVLSVGTPIKLREVKVFEEMVSPKVVAYFTVGDDGKMGIVESSGTSPIDLWSWPYNGAFELNPEYFRHRAP